MPPNSENQQSNIENTLLVTGTFAESAVRQVAAALGGAKVAVLNIQVAALMTAEWVDRKLSLPEGQTIERVILPGYCRGDLSPIAQRLGIAVETGPRDVRDLPEAMGRQARRRPGYGDFDIEIIAEINHAAHQPTDQIIAQAQRLRDDGADVIDIGCDPQADRDPWTGVADVVRELKARGMRVSIDSFHQKEIGLACRAGAELVLSVNAGNRQAAADWGAEVVVLPDDLQTLAGLDESIAWLEKKNVPYRIDPVIEPIGLGFAASLKRYWDVRQRYPQAAMMMGVGNLSEMTEVDSAGVNALLLGFCQELAIGSVLTTQVINWCRSCVRELDAARRLMHYAIEQRVPPKHLDDRLVMLRDPKLRGLRQAYLNELADRLTDRNVRIFADAESGRIHAMHKDAHAVGDDPFEVFDQLGIDDASHAFYLGFEMCKAMLAMQLGKNYTQDEALRFGLLTREEKSHFERRKKKGPGG